MSAVRARKPYSRPSTDGQWLHDKAHLGGGGPRNARPAKHAPVANFATETTTNNKLLVSNLHYEITPKDLNSIFGQIGTLVREPLIRYDRSGRSSGTAVVTYEAPSDAAKAKTQFDGLLAKGQAMEITFDKSVPRRPSSSASLLNRIEKQPLLERLSNADKSNKADAQQARGGAGPVRNKKGRVGPKAKSKPKTAEELDQELEAFMGPSGSTSDSASKDTAANATALEDVEMA